MSYGKTSEQIEIMRRGGKILGGVLRELVEISKAGISGDELDKRSAQLIKERGARSAFLGFQGFPANICLSINEEILHGIPFGKILKSGDVVSLDAGLIYQGLYVDAAVSFVVRGGGDRGQEVEKESFLQAGKSALVEAIKQAVPGQRVGDISFAIQTIIEQSGFNVIREYCGHGVGEKLHESPSIPCFGKKGTGEILADSQTLAIEVMYVANDSTLTVEPDGWTVVAKNGRIAGMFEHTVLITGKGPEILTL